MAMSAAERQRKRRAKLKTQEPDKYEEKKRKHAEHMRKIRKPIGQLSETEQEKRRKQWREASKKRNNKTKQKKGEKQPPLAEFEKKYRALLERAVEGSYAEHQRKRREKLKTQEPDKCEEKNRKHADYMRKIRKPIDQLSETRKMAMSAAERQRKWREKLQTQEPDKYEEKFKTQQPDKYEEEKRKHAEYMRKIRKPIGQLSETRKMAMSAAERQRKRREKLKTQEPDKYEEKKRKHAEYMRKITKPIGQLSETEQEKRRKQWREASEKRNNKTKQKKGEKQPPLAEFEKKYRALLERVVNMIEVIKNLTRQINTLEKKICLLAKN